ncbi:MAG TPA: DnaJ domain-containing protein [Methylomirabilota bacterium]|nr:DnaJ domain-containing protein [Methylomirabilota bacterium]
MARQRADRDYYAALGVAPDASEDEIRRTYRRLALEWHPDRNPGDPRAEERFKEISEAYAVLMDAAKRRAYDQARGAGVPGDFGPSREDLFRDLFADPRASAIFEELARELERMGTRVDRRDFERTLFGGRVVVTGGVFVISPLTPARMLWRLGRAALRAAPAPPRVEPAPAPGGLLGRALEAGRRLLGLPGRAVGPGTADVTFPLRLTAAEADRGGRKRVTLRRADGDDEVLVTVPAGTRGGARLRLRGKGRLLAGGARGDAYLVVEVAGERGRTTTA